METTEPVSAQPAYRKLGTRTLWMMLSDQMVPSVIVFVAAVLLSIAQANGVFAKTIIGAWSLYLVFGVWALCVLVFVITFLIAYLTYANFLFMLDNDALKIRRGILSKEETAIPYRQIQDVDIEQDISERIWASLALRSLRPGMKKRKKGRMSPRGSFLPLTARLPNLYKPNF